MKTLLVITALLLGGCVENGSAKILTYNELVDYPVSCDLARPQLAELQAIQKAKHFPTDPDDIKDEADRAYNSRLKATIWWYTYRCYQ